MDGVTVTSIHGIPVSFKGLESGGKVGRFLVHGDLKLLNGAAGLNGTTDMLRALASSGAGGGRGLRIVVGNDFIAESDTRVT